MGSTEPLPILTNKILRIIHLIPNLSQGGASNICIDLCNYLSATNEVLLITLCEYDSGMLSLTSISEKVQMVSFHKEKGLSLRLIWDVYKELKRLKPDVLHAHMVGLFYCVLYLATFPRTKSFYTFHTLANKDAPKYYRVFYKQLFRFFRVKPIPISSAVKKSIWQYYKIRSEEVIYHGVKKDINDCTSMQAVEEIASYKKSRFTKIFVNIARVSEEKNHYMLIESFKRLIREEYDILLLIIGSTPDSILFKKLEDFADPYIRFLGAKENIFSYLKIADGFCLTSKYEGLSLATIEALSMRVIPICTPVGGVLEIIQDSYNGLLSEDCTVDSYVKALKRFLVMDNPEKETMRSNTFTTYKERFTLERCGEEYLALYNRILKETMR